MGHNGDYNRYLSDSWLILQYRLTILCVFLDVRMCHIHIWMDFGTWYSSTVQCTWYNIHLEITPSPVVVDSLRQYRIPCSRGVQLTTVLEYSSFYRGVVWCGIKVLVLQYGTYESLIYCWRDTNWANPPSRPGFQQGTAWSPTTIVRHDETTANRQ
jgi:hypothetical protein